MADVTRIRIARATVFFSGAIGAVFALTVRGIFDVLLLAFAVYVASLFVPVMTALFWKKATKAGAFASAGGAFVVLCVLYGLRFAGLLSADVEPIIASMAFGFIVMIVVSLATWRGGTTPPLSTIRIRS